MMVSYQLSYCIFCITGFDFAFYQNGYRYHTKFDDFQNIPPGSYQHVGDNILTLVKNLASAPEVSEGDGVPGKMIYYDIFGFFMISYTTRTAFILNIVTVLLSVAVFFYGLWECKIGNSIH